MVHDCHPSFLEGRGRRMVVRGQTVIKHKTLCEGLKEKAKRLKAKGLEA